MGEGGANIAGRMMENVGRLTKCVMVRVCFIMLHV